jgi:putative ABC transport system permease protein
VRVAPVAAIQPVYATGIVHPHRRAIRAAGRTFRLMPYRNLRRSPRRTVLTVFAIAAAVTVLTGFLGIMDSVFGAVDTAEAEATGGARGRITVSLDTFRPIGSAEVVAVGAADTVAVAEPGLRLVGALRSGDTDMDVFVVLADLRNGMWQPTIDGSLGVEPGLVLTEKSAADLGVSVGGTVTLRHPLRQGFSYTFVETELPVVATHPYPVRGFVYMDLSHAGLFNLEGITNTMNVLAAEGAATADVQRELFALEQVTSVQSVTAVTEAVRDSFSQILGIIQVIVVAVLLLVLLIAFNTAAINLEARAREHATMFAFGVKIRTALRMAVVESLAIGTLATLIGIGGGLAMVWWMTQRLLTRTLPEFSLGVMLRPETLGLVAVMGILAVALAPLLTVRRMRRMDLSGALRLME